MDFNTFKNRPRSSQNSGKAIDAAKAYIDECLEEGTQPDPELLVSNDKFIDQYTFNELKSFREIGFDIRHAAAYRYRFQVLAHLDAKQKTLELIEMRQARRKFQSELYNKTTCNHISTESRTIDGSSPDRSTLPRRTRNRARRNARKRLKRHSDNILYHDVDGHHLHDHVTCELCEGRGEITFDQYESIKIFTESKTADDGDMAIHGAAENNEIHENVSDHVGEKTELVTDLGVDINNSMSGTKTEYSLDSFFKRPVLIYQGNWAIDTNQDIQLKVWDLWSKDPSVRAKLNNYAFFRGTLHAKIAFTGSPYHYGTAMASYQPYGGYNSNLQMYDGVSPVLKDTRTAYLCYLSQAPGVTYFDYKENRPKEIVIPFISHKQKFRLFNNNNNVLTNATSYTDFDEAGELRLATLNSPKDANDDNATGVGVAIYIWATDVELGSITSTDVNITAESKEIFTESKTVKAAFNRYKDVKENPDEYTEPGPVSKVATAVSAAASQLTDIPYIGPFAKATSTVSKMMGDVAMMFGFSRPLVIDDAQFRKNMPFVNGAVTMGKDTAYKISIDPKQELTIDPSLGGMETDQMAIKEIAGRESYLTTFEWNQSNAENTSILWKSLVLPGMFVPIYDTPAPGVIPNRWVQPTAMMFAAQPFLSWRGTIRFRFEVVCSKFHRGKLLFKFDPNVPANVLISSAPTRMNQQNVIILDIQEAQDIIIDVDWAFARDWCNNKLMSAYNLPNGIVPEEGHPGHNDNISEYQSGQSNGFLEVRPFTTLSQPTANSPVYINTFVSCPDLEVARLSNRNMPPERRIFTEATEVTVQKINDTGAKVSDKMYLNHFGERIVSFRNLLKRYVTNYSNVLDGLPTGAQMQTTTGTLWPHDTLPVGINSITNTDLDRSDLFSYLKYAYLGVRGGYRHRFITTTDNKNMGYTRISLDGGTSPLTNGLYVTQVTPVGATIAASDSNFAANINGSLIFHQDTNGGFEFEIPYYSRNLFDFAFSTDYGFIENQDKDVGFEEKLASANWRAQQCFSVTDTGSTLVTQVDSASAEDFTFLRFQGAPGFRSFGLEYTPY
jgi:hypothetical protein